MKKNVDEMTKKDFPILDYTFVEMVNKKNEEEKEARLREFNRMKEKSLKEHKTKVYGEYYVSNNSNKKKYIKKAVIKAVEIVAIGTVLVYSTITLGKMEQSGDIQKIVNKVNTVQELNGSFREQNVYSDEFREYFNGLTMDEMIDGYNEKKDELVEINRNSSDPSLNEYLLGDLSVKKEVIDYWQDSYIKENKVGKGR